MAGHEQLALPRGLSSYVTSLCACIEAARDVQAVTALLQQAKDLLLLDGAPDARNAALTRPAADRVAGAEMDADAARQHPESPVPQQPPQHDQRLAELAARAQTLRSCASASGQANALQLVLWGAPFVAIAGMLLSGAVRYFVPSCVTYQ